MTEPVGPVSRIQIKELEVGIQPSPMPNAVKWNDVKIGDATYHTLMVTGSREYNDLRQLSGVLAEYAAAHNAKHPDVNLILVSGHAQRGADVLAEMVWSDFGPVAIEPADWNTHTEGRCKCGPDANFCRLAGIIRNEKMVEDYQPSVVVAFYEPTAENRGTNHAADYARDRNIPVRVVIAPTRPVEPAPLEITKEANNVESFIAGSL